MGFWNNVWQKTVSAARWVGNKVVKPTLKTARKVVNWVGRRVDDLYTGAKKIVSGAHSIIDGIGNMLGIPTPPRYEEAIIVGEPMPVPAGMDAYYNEVRHKLEQQYQFELNRMAEAQQEDIRAMQARHDAQMKEIARAHKQRERLYEVVNLASTLKAHAEKVESNPRFHQFDEFARLKISTRFLNNLLKQLAEAKVVEALSKDQFLMLKSIDQFIIGEMSDAEYAQFDELIMKIFNEDLLQIGSREIISEYRADYEVKKQEWQAASEKATGLNIKIIAKEDYLKRVDDTQEKSQLEREIAELKQEHLQIEAEKGRLFEIKSTADEYGISLDAILYIASNDIALTDREMRMAKGVGEIYIKYKQVGKDDFSFSKQELEEIIKFNNLALRRDWTMKQKGGTEIEMEV